MESERKKKQTYRLRGLELDAEAAEAKLNYDITLSEEGENKTKIDNAYRKWQAAERVVILFRNHITNNMINIDAEIPTL
ncbi:MAG: hypothetical protein WAQ28_17725 [Bacteroidia bacterium]|jgi:hypothetical protein